MREEERDLWVKKGGSLSQEGIRGEWRRKEKENEKRKA
jgi:hypothetical protein